jgi:hypothetical protein
MTIIRVAAQSELSNDFIGAYDNYLLVRLGRVKNIMVKIRLAYPCYPSTIVLTISVPFSCIRRCKLYVTFHICLIYTIVVTLRVPQTTRNATKLHFRRPYIKFRQHPLCKIA